TDNYQPVNITFALLEPLPEADRKRVRRKRERHQLQVERALTEWNNWLHQLHTDDSATTSNAAPLAAGV
ncbi:MAG: methylenetetrahydrofolate--tRNA-(uracil(54)-C(5))-methyltransferase (FADH(2)-oxidizing) TrmFO, partial [Acidobacteria bacterium]|nr:methylenetetrahydrofolate--tRNA-(uracil(54)-C(5))-methyltransferase (FADH(2)-oxidizing) TrmFO [Acidobacteriota bacterium]